MSASRAEIELLLTVARMYYEQDLTQAQIAKKIGYSRITVSRLLQRARTSGIVKISIVHPLSRALELEAALRQKYGLKTARVAASGEDLEVSRAVGRAAAELLEETGGRGKVIAVSNGRAVAATIRELGFLNWDGACAVQILGTVANGSLPEDSPEVCSELAERIGGVPMQLPIPMILGSAQLAKQMRKEAQVTRTLALARHADIALLGVGGISPEGKTSPILDDFSSHELWQQVRQMKPVAHICGHHLDQAGRHLSTPLCARTISLEPPALKGIPTTIGVAWGAEKVIPIAAVIRGGYINTLVTDAPTALALLQLQEPPRSRAREGAGR